MNDQAAFQQRINYGDPLMRDEYIKLHEAERAFKKTQDDRELRRWCMEQVPDTFVCAGDRIEQAEALYDWIRNQKADAA